MGFNGNSLLAAGSEPKNRLSGPLYRRTYIERSASIARHEHQFGAHDRYFAPLCSRSKLKIAWVKTIAEAIDKFRADFENKLGTKVFMIGNEYQTSSMLSFYLKDKRSEGPGHPPSISLNHRTSRTSSLSGLGMIDFVEADPSVKRDTTFTEEAGVNLFIDRTALYITDRPEANPPQNLQSAFTRCQLLAVYELERNGLPLRQVRIFACYQYQDSAVVMTPQVSVIIPVWNEEGNVRSVADGIGIGAQRY